MDGRARFPNAIVVDGRLLLRVESVVLEILQDVGTTGSAATSAGKNGYGERGQIAAGE
jgi:hypothetical protein